MKTLLLPLALISKYVPVGKSVVFVAGLSGVDNGASIRVSVTTKVTVISALLTYRRLTNGHYRACLNQCLVKAKTERKQTSVCDIPG